MKQKRYTEEQIIGFLKAHEAGTKVSDLVREHALQTEFLSLEVQIWRDGCV
jgi:hypothetical protein